MNQERKAAAFGALHAGPPFVIPNPWDAGSARMLAALGFSALATTSSGFAFTLGRRDGDVSVEELTAHVAAVDRATELPISVDLENGLAADADGVAATLAQVAEAGAVGASIEDWDPESGRIYEREHAVERLTAAVEAARRLPFSFVLTGRAENQIRGNPDLGDTIARLQAYEAAGADVLYAPGLETTDDVRAVCASVQKPVNVLARPTFAFTDLAEAGARRISVGGSLTWAAVNAAAAAAEAIRDGGDFSLLGSSPPLQTWLA
jgi:2-methylisocitrate lyase-like PEP mutase family enzyme